MAKVWYWVVRKGNPTDFVVRSYGTPESATSCWLGSTRVDGERFLWGSPDLKWRDLAVSILYDTCGSMDVANRYADDFVIGILAQLSYQGWHLDQGTVRAWLSVVQGQEIVTLATINLNWRDS